MSEKMSREQYDNAVRIRENGYDCNSDTIKCWDCVLYSIINCGSSKPNHKDHGLRILLMDSTISTYEAEHPDEFRTSPDDIVDQCIDIIYAWANEHEHLCTPPYKWDELGKRLSALKPKINQACADMDADAKIIDALAERIRAHAHTMKAKDRGVKSEQIVVEE